VQQCGQEPGSAAQAIQPMAGAGIPVGPLPDGEHANCFARRAGPRPKRDRPEARPDEAQSDQPKAPKLFSGSTFPAGRLLVARFSSTSPAPGLQADTPEAQPPSSAESQEHLPAGRRREQPSRDRLALYQFVKQLWEEARSGTFP
jgi:hypothetical protein